MGLFNALARGHRFEAGREGIDMVVDDEAIGFALYQTICRSLHIATEEGTRRSSSHASTSSRSRIKHRSVRLKRRGKSPPFPMIVLRRAARSVGVHVVE
ncbi:hypothetical protein [Sphingobium herbicidovorans]